MLLAATRGSKAEILTYVRKLCGSEHQDHDHVRPHPDLNEPTTMSRREQTKAYDRPYQDHVCPRIAIPIVLLRGGITVLLLGRRSISQSTSALRPQGINILSCSGKGDLHHLLAIGPLDFLGAAQIFGGPVVTFRAPSNVVLSIEKVMRRYRHR